MDENATRRSVGQLHLTPATPALSRLLAAHGADGPDDAPVQAIHRGPDGYIPLAVKENGREWRELGAVKIGQPFLPGLLAQLSRDGYFGLNSSFTTGARYATKERWVPIPGMAPAEERKAVKVRQSTNPATGLPWQRHETRTLRWLNVAYADLDCYKLGIDVGAAIGALINLQDEGVLPPATLLARSGRGLWAFWFLLDGKNPTEGETFIHGAAHRPETPARATRRALALYARVQRAIAEKLMHLGADLGAVDGPRYAPMPGTEKTGGADRVRYWVQGTDNGVPAYTLPHLADRLGLELRKREHPVIEAALSVEPDDAPRDAVKAAAGRKGWKQRWLYAVADLEILMKLRGGTFMAPDVSRNVAAFYYAIALTRAGMNPEDVERRIEALGHRCGLEPHEIGAAVAQARKRKGIHLSTRRLLADLRVTDVERGYLRPRQVADATHPAAIGARRQAIIDAITDNGGRVPSVRQMAALLQAEGVPCGSSGTVWRDYRALGLKPASKAGRPAKLPL